MLTTSLEELVDRFKSEEIVQDLYKSLKSIRLKLQELKTCISNHQLLIQLFSQEMQDPPQLQRILSEWSD